MWDRPSRLRFQNPKPSRRVSSLLRNPKPQSSRRIASLLRNPKPQSSRQIARLPPETHRGEAAPTMNQQIFFGRSGVTHRDQISVAANIAAPTKSIAARQIFAPAKSVFPPFKLRFLLHLKAQGRLPACPFAAIAAHPWRASPPLISPYPNPREEASAGSLRTTSCARPANRNGSACCLFFERVFDAQPADFTAILQVLAV